MRIDIRSTIFDVVFLNAVEKVSKIEVEFWRWSVNVKTFETSRDMTIIIISIIIIIVRDKNKAFPFRKGIEPGFMHLTRIYNEILMKIINKRDKKPNTKVTHSRENVDRSEM